MVYTAPPIAIAVLETAAHIDDAGLPLNQYMVSIAVPDAVWARREILDVSRLDATWAAIPAGRSSVRQGSAWIRRGASAPLVVPSVAVPEESAVLINAARPDAAWLTARVERLFEYNRLFRAT